jgi:O-antigen/teichoic acid export membrane protein
LAAQSRLLQRLRQGAWARVSKNTLALFVAQAGARALNLALIALVTRALGVAGLGRYLLAMTVQSIALAVTDLGLNTYTTREFAKAEWARDAGRVAGSDAALWRVVLTLKLVSALCGVVALNVLLVPVLLRRQGTLTAAGVAIVSLSLLPDALNALATALIKARQRMEVSAAILLGTRLVYTLAGGGLLWLGYDERSLLAAYGLVSLLGTCAYWIVLRVRPFVESLRIPFIRQASPAFVERRGIQWRAFLPQGGLLVQWRGVLRESTPFAVTGIVAMLYARADLLLLSFWQGDAAAGLYGTAYRLWEAMGMIPSSFLDALFPELSRLGSRGADWERLRALYRRGWRIVCGGAVLLAVAAQFAATTLILLLYGRTPDTSFSVGILRVLLFAFPFTYLYLLNGHTLYAVGRQQGVTVAMVVVTAIKVLLNALAISRWSYWGAAGVALASEVTLFAWLQVVVWRFVLRPSAVWPVTGMKEGDGSTAE